MRAGARKKLIGNEKICDLAWWLCVVFSHHAAIQEPLALIVAFCRVRQEVLQESGSWFDCKDMGKHVNKKDAAAGVHRVAIRHCHYSRCMERSHWHGCSGFCFCARRGHPAEARRVKLMNTLSTGGGDIPGSLSRFLEA